MKKIYLLLFLSYTLTTITYGQTLIEDLSLSMYSDQTSIQALKSVTLTNGFHIPAGKTVTISIVDFQNLLSRPSADRNYILTRTFRTAIKKNELNNSRTIRDENQTIQYFDGLGRPIQTVDLMASPNYRDIVQHIEYDSLGLESVKYLQYGEKPNGLGYNDLSYKVSAKENLSAYYSMTESWDGHVSKTKHPYAVTIFENSPIKRTIDQGAAGADWQPYNPSIINSGHTIKTVYGTNTGDEVSYWSSFPGYGQIVRGAPRRSGDLLKTTTRGENWISGKSGTVDEYKDKQGRVILKRVWESEVKSLSTYFIYDNLSNLLYVLPPEVTDINIYGPFSYNENEELFNEFIYAYHYDVRNRMVERKIPGKGWEYFIYNDSDHLILTQDEKQRETNKWNYIKYDAFGRVASTGIYTNSTIGQTSRVEVQSLADATAIHWEIRSGSASYTNLAFPNTVSQLAEYTVNYYDDYNFSGASTAALQASGITKTQLTSSLLTGKRVSKDDGTAPLLTINYYDDRGDLIQSVSQNHLGGTDLITNEYNFSGDLIKNKHIHIANGVTTTILNTNMYDHIGRLLESKNYINDPNKEVILAKYEYNEVGQLKKKSIGGDKNGNNYHTSIDNSYNERGWSKGATSPYFTYQLNYNTNNNGEVLHNANYNGNISQQLWGHGADPTSTFTYTYDKLNRLTKGASTGTAVIIEEVSYDNMGNIKTLARNTGNTATTALTNYTYQNNNRSNKLAGLSGAITGNYTYDLNGNALTDRTGMNFRYNHLNLPDSAWNNGATVKVGYLYDANGTKLRKYSTQGGNKDYLGGIEYNGTTIELIHTGVGVAFRNNDGTYTYRYNLTDHLGNIRSTVYRNPANSNAVEVLQKDDYYPFGKQRIVAAGNNKYLYNGKETQGELGGQYDYGARFYDAEIGRWNVVDPLADSYSSYSPYNYTANNPILFIDPDGRYLKEYDDAEAYYAENPNGKLDGSDGHWRTSDRKYNTSVWKNANKTNIQKNDGFKEYENLDQRADFYRWFQDETSSRGFETRWAGAAASTVDKLKNLLGFGATMTGYSNDEIKNFVTSGNKMIMDDVWGGLQDLYNGKPVKGDAASIWDGDQLLKEQNVINGSYWKLSNSSLNTLENSLKKNYFLSKFIPGPLFNGSIMSITDRWKYGMGMMGYKNLPPISIKYKHQ